MLPTKLPGEDFINSWYPIAIALAVGLLIGLRSYMQGPRCPSEEKMKGKTVVVTGANSGIGKETAKDLARRGARVILACRDEEKGKAAADEIIHLSRNKEVVYMKLDLASFQSVKDFVAKFKENEQRLDVLINNAGVLLHPQEKTQDDIELHFQVNYLSHFLLTHLLLDTLKASAPSRIINITALAYRIASLDLVDINCDNKEYKPGEAYSMSKLALVMFTRELARHLEGSNVTVNVVQPGVVNSDGLRHMPFKQSKFLSFSLFPLTFMLMKRPVDGAQTVIYTAVAKEEQDVSGKLYQDCQIKEVAEDLMSEDAIKALWKCSLEMTGVTLEASE